ncbi:MAG: hypothetical protein WC898_03305 [Candidatus Paceibacterota bacterium]|jgi:hypothetical protein
MRSLFLKKIIVTILSLAIFLAPVALVVNKNHDIKIQKNETLAVDLSDEFSPPPVITQIGKAYNNSAKFALTINALYTGRDCNNNGIIETFDEGSQCPEGKDDTLGSYDGLEGEGNPAKGIYIFFIKGKIAEDQNVFKLDEEKVKIFTLKEYGAKIDISASIQNLNIIVNPSTLFTEPPADKNYSVRAVLVEDNCGFDINSWYGWPGTLNPVDFITCDFHINSNVVHFTTVTATEEEKIEDAENSITQETINDVGKGVFGCSATDASSWFTNCLVQALYEVVFVPLASITRLAAYFLDFFVYYSTNSSSYSSAFVEKAWGTVRDVANIFFIIILLYIAVKTVLGLNVSNNKKMIGMVIIIALLINFSLFATKVVIDASNILAKVFYNNISSVDEKGGEVAEGKGGEKTISVGLVAQFDPQKMVGEGGVEGNLGIFTVLTVLSILLLVYMIYIFLSVSFLFIGRVASLWLSMIFSPIAFISYAVPFKIPKLGHDDWLKNLTENAILAPLFIFFLYIIIMFGDSFKLITYDVGNSTDWMDKIMKVFIPFGIVFALLQQAKKLAVQYSGDIGAMINKGGAMVGGFALGAVTGGAGLLATNTLGRYAKYVANNDELREKAAGGDKEAQKKLARANYFAGKSYDFRQSGIGKAFQKGTGLNLDKGTSVLKLDTKTLKGGRNAQQERVNEKAIEKNKTYEMTKDAASKQSIRASQYQKDEAFAKEFSKKQGVVWDEDMEKDFKEKYEHDEYLGSYGINRKVGTGSVETPESINIKRRNDYADKLQEKEDMRTAFGTLLDEFKKGMKKMGTTPGGIGITLAAGAFAGPLGAGVAVVGGGFLKALQETLVGGVKEANKETIASIRKGEHPNKSIVNELRKLTNQEHGSEEKLFNIAKKMPGAETKSSSEEPKKGH